MPAFAAPGKDQQAVNNTTVAEKDDAAAREDGYIRPKSRHDRKLANKKQYRTDYQPEQAADNKAFAVFVSFVMHDAANPDMKDNNARRHP